MSEQLELALPTPANEILVRVARRRPKPTPREVWQEEAEACADKAERVMQFDAEGAGKFILGWLVRYGDTAGERLVDEATAHGFRAHDARAFGAVFQQLVRRNQIRCTGYCQRRKGHGTSGGRIWALVR